MSQTSAEPTTHPSNGGRHGVTVKVNNKPVVISRRRVTGLQIKEAAIAQGVEIELDFILTLEARGGKPAETTTTIRRSPSRSIQSSSRTTETTTRK